MNIKHRQAVKVLSKDGRDTVACGILGLDPENRKMRRDFTRRILVNLHDLKKE
jgi:hypothetical protein